MSGTEDDALARAGYAAVLTRRSLLMAAALTGVGLAAGACGARTQPDAAGADAGVFFSGPEMAILALVSEIIIPETDTPGARAANVPEFIDGLMEGWARSTTQAQFRRVFLWFDETARADGGRGFVDLAPAEQVELVQGVDQRVFVTRDEALPGEVGNGYRRLKWAVFRGYYLSRIGATQELAYDAVPGGFRGCVPVSEIGRTWAT